LSFLTWLDLNYIKVPPHCLSSAGTEWATSILFTY
jgi:hypothetical protein